MKNPKRIRNSSGKLRSGAVRAANARQEQIDQAVIEAANDDLAWDTPVAVTRSAASVGLPAGLAQRASFLARLHRERNLQTWVQRVVRERVELEERAFTQARAKLARKAGA